MQAIVGLGSRVCPAVVFKENRNRSRDGDRPLTTCFQGGMRKNGSLELQQRDRVGWIVLGCKLVGTAKIQQRPPWMLDYSRVFLCVSLFPGGCLPAAGLHTLSDGGGRAGGAHAHALLRDHVWLRRLQGTCLPYRYELLHRSNVLFGGLIEKHHVVQIGFQRLPACLRARRLKSPPFCVRALWFRGKEQLRQAYLFS